MHKKSRIYAQAITLLCAVFMLASPKALAAMGPSPWAAPQIEQAISLGLVPDALQSDYQSPITREDFCSLLYHVLFGQETEISLEQENPFTDVDDPQIRYLAQRGIVSGYGNGVFAPQDGLTRQQAAVLLTNAARDFGRDLARDMSFMFQSPMSDRAGFAAWAADSIAWVRRASIMTGTMANKFDPQGQYTREQAIITMLRFHDVVIGQKDYRNFQNYIVSLVPVTIENDIFSMVIPANSPYHKDIEEVMLNYCDWVQEASGLSLFPEGTKYDKIRIGYQDADSYYGRNEDMYLWEVEHMLDGSSAPYFPLSILSWMLQDRTVHTKCPPFNDAFRFLNSAKAAKNNGMDYIYWYIMSYNFNVFEPEDERRIIAPGYETLFRSGKDSWEMTCVSLRFGVFLEQQYGTDILQNVIKKYAEKMQGNTATRDDFVDFLKQQTDQNVFEAFVSWYWENTALFNQSNTPELQTERFVCMPIITKYYQGFSDYQRFFIDKMMEFDFHEANAYVQHRGYQINGIYGSFYSDKEVTVTTFNETGKMVARSVVKPNSYVRIESKGATKLVVTGDNVHIRFMPLFEHCYSK